MSESKCPKCGRAVSDEVICPGCDFVLDTSFLGEDITDNVRDERAARKKNTAGRKSTVIFGEDDLILGNAHSAEFDSFASADTGFVQREVTHARIYIGALTGALLAPDAIPARVDGVDAKSLKLNPFETHVLTFVNGKRPVGRIRKKSGMAKDEVKTALATLADKGIIRHGGVVSEERKQRAKEKRRKRKGSDRASRHRGRRRSSKKRPPEPREATQVQSPSGASLVDPPSPEGKDDPSFGPFDDPTLAVPARSATRNDVSEKARPSAATPAPRISAFDAQFVEQDNEPSIFDAATGEIEKKAVGFDDSDVETGALEVESVALSDFDAAPVSIADEPETKVLLSRWPSKQGEESVVDGLDHSPEELVASLTGAPAKPPASPFDSASAEAAGAGFDGHDDPTGLFDPGNVSAISLASDDFASIENSEASALPPAIPDEPSIVDAPAIDQLPSAALQPIAPQSAAPSPEVAIPVGNVLPPLPAGPPPSLPGSTPPPSLPGGSPPPPVPAPAPAAARVYDDDVDLDDEPEAEEAIDWADPVEADEPPPAAAPPAVSAAPAPALAIGQVELKQVPAPSSAAAVDDSDEDDAVHDESDEESDSGPAGPEVPFALRRKAAKIFEQAEKDAAAENFSSARMNAKLAMIYDGNNKRYKKMFDVWSGKGGQVAKAAAREVVLFQQSKTAESNGNFAKAVKLMEDAIAVAPAAAPLYNRLGVLLATRMKDYRAASEHLLTACELAPQNLSFKNNLGKVLGMAEGQREKGPKKWFQREKQEDEMVRVKKIRPKFL